MEYKSKITWQLDSPYNQHTLPKVSAEHLNTIVDLLCRLISPIGQYRRNHITPSKGKRRRKRDRKTKSANGKSTENTETLIPTVPEISSYIVYGLNAVLRSLESLTALSSVQSKDHNELETLEEKNTAAIQNLSLSNRHFLAIFIVSSSQQLMIEEILPHLVVTASFAHSTHPQTRLVKLPSECHNRLCTALNIPRVSVIGILEDAPLSKGLTELIRSCVPEISMPWLQVIQGVHYMPVKVNAIESLVATPVKRQKCK